MKLLVLTALFTLQFTFVGAVSSAQTASSDEQEVQVPEVQIPRAPSAEGSSQLYNIRFSPLGFLIGYLNVDFDFKVSDNWTVGPTISYWSFDFDSSYYQNGKIKTSLTNIGVRGTFAPKGAFKNGIYFTPMFQYRSAKAEGIVSTTGERVVGTASLPVLTGIVGYQHWLGENLNFNVGAGLAVAPTTKIEVRDNTSTTSVETSQSGGLALDMMLGYSF